MSHGWPDYSNARESQRRLRGSLQNWRGSPYALFLVATLLAMGGGGCSADGSDPDGGPTPPGGKPKPPLPVPAEFRDRLARLVYEKKLADTAAYLRSVDPTLLARSASERGDIQYLTVMGIGPVTPGIPPVPRPARTWILPGTSDTRSGPDDERYQLLAHDFAKAYNEALAKEERGVR